MNDVSPDPLPQPNASEPLREAVHGTFSAYANGCRCDACVVFRRTYDRNRDDRVRPSARRRLMLRNEALAEALDRIARSSRDVSGQCVWCGNDSLATHHADDCPKEIARTALMVSR